MPGREGARRLATVRSLPTSETDYGEVQSAPQPSEARHVADNIAKYRNTRLLRETGFTRERTDQECRKRSKNKHNRNTSETQTKRKRNVSGIERAKKRTRFLKTHKRKFTQLTKSTQVSSKKANAKAIEETKTGFGSLKRHFSLYGRFIRAPRDRIRGPKSLNKLILSSADY